MGEHCWKVSWKVYHVIMERYNHYVDAFFSWSTEQSSQKDGFFRSLSIPHGVKAIQGVMEETGHLHTRSLGALTK